MTVTEEMADRRNTRRLCQAVEKAMRDEAPFLEFEVTVYANTYEFMVEASDVEDPDNREYRSIPKENLEGQTPKDVGKTIARELDRYRINSRAITIDRIGQADLYSLTNKVICGVQEQGLQWPEFWIDAREQRDQKRDTTFLKFSIGPAGKELPCARKVYRSDWFTNFPVITQLKKARIVGKYLGQMLKQELEKQDEEKHHDHHTP